MTTATDVRIKLCCVGDGGIGKTCLLTVFATGIFPTDYIPTVFETYAAQLPYGTRRMAEMELWDTAGQEDFDRLRPLSYAGTNVVLICFAIDVPVSLANVADKWFAEITHFCPGVPIILVGTKTDLRTDTRTIGLLAAQGRTPITYEEGCEEAKKMGATYMECAAINRGTGVVEIFDKALKLSLKDNSSKAIKRKIKNCTIL